MLQEICSLDGSLSSSRNLSRLSAGLPSEEGAYHPLHGYKRDLVRLIGNFLYGSKIVQEHVREKGGVSLLLNLCTIDHRNPCILEFKGQQDCPQPPKKQQISGQQHAMLVLLYVDRIHFLHTLNSMVT